MFKNVIAENFPNLRKELDIQVNETHRTPNYHNAKRSSARYIISKLSKVNDKGFKSGQGKKVVTYKCTPIRLSADI